MVLVDSSAPAWFRAPKAVQLPDTASCIDIADSMIVKRGARPELIWSRQALEISPKPSRLSWCEIRRSNMWKMRRSSVAEDNQSYSQASINRSLTPQPYQFSLRTTHSFAKGTKDPSPAIEAADTISGYGHCQAFANIPSVQPKSEVPNNYSRILILTPFESLLGTGVKKSRTRFTSLSHTVSSSSISFPNFPNTVASTT